jgi:DNA-binding NtrC family response regulator
VTSADEELPTTPESSAHEAYSPLTQRTLGFAILYCAEAPERTGAFIPVPPSSEMRPRIFGRGPARASDDHVRLRAILQRPGENLQPPPFESTSLSRVQLEVREFHGGIELVNVGKCSLAINGQSVTRGHIAVGDIIAIGRQLLLLCVERPLTLKNEGWRASHAHGGPDEHGIVGESAAVWRLRQEIRFAAARPGHVLILGSSGTGKELVGRAIHALSRPGKPWVARNAGTFPETLIDAELFGNAKGYPNVGTPERTGLIGAADQGSLFLDEFAELALAAQTHLLRVMDAGEYQRLGETHARHAEFRLIAATNRPATDLRPDVLARFAFRIQIPDLAARREDIPLLTRHWLRLLAKEDPTLEPRFFDTAGEPQLSLDFVLALVRRPLVGNARELRNLLWQAISASEGDVLQLSPEVADVSAEAGAAVDLTALQIQAALHANGGSLEKTWRQLGLSSRFALMRLMKKSALKIEKLPRRR